MEKILKPLRRFKNRRGRPHIHRDNGTYLVLSAYALASLHWPRITTESCPKGSKVNLIFL